MLALTEMKEFFFTIIYCVPALALIATLSALSGIFGLLGSPFIAVLQLVVYAGAIMVLFLFVLMLVNVRREEERSGTGRRLRWTALGVCALFVAQVGAVLTRLELAPSAAFPPTR